MINKYDQKYNRVHLLNKSKWTAIKKVNGWRHFMVKDVNKKNKTVEMFAVCDRKSMMTIDISELKPKKKWIRGWHLLQIAFFAMKKLNRELQFASDKSCKFTCALSLCWPDGYNITVQGEICGEFSWPPSGRNGFGYDPIFYYPKLKKTFGELDPAIKHEISHRNLAFKKLKTEIKKICL